MQTDDYTADLITEEDRDFLVIPAKVLKRLTQKYAALNVILHTTIREWLSLRKLPCGTGFDQRLLRELRTSQPAAKPFPIFS